MCSYESRHINYKFFWYLAVHRLSKTEKLICVLRLLLIHYKERRLQLVATSVLPLESRTNITSLVALRSQNTLDSG